VITNKSLVQPMADDMARRFAAGVGTHYDFKARQQGYIVVRDEAGNEQKVGLMALSVGILTSDEGPFTDIREITEAATAKRRERSRP